jgi:hypothetical protein
MSPQDAEPHPIRIVFIMTSRFGGFTAETSGVPPFESTCDKKVPHWIAE